MPPPSLLEWIATWPWAEAAVILFGFAWGAMLGSFVNVVVHRLPLGESVVLNRSRCPRCGRPIRPTDNVPVLGWIRLKGACRDCGQAIAVEYPLVEAACGLIVAVLVAAHLVGGGRWLPRMGGGYPAGIDRLLRGEWRLLVACGLESAVVLAVLTWTLLERRGWPPPATSLWPPLLAVAVTIAAVPAAGPPGLLPGGGDWPTGPPALAALAAGATGAAVGWLVGRAGLSAGVRVGLPLVGSVLGWQAGAVVAVVAVAMDRAGGGRGRWRGLGGFGLVTLATLCLAFQGLLGTRAGG